MRISDIRTMRLTGPDAHGIGGRARTISFLLLRIDTDAGTFGIGEAADFPGVRSVIEWARPWLIGRDPLVIGPVVRALVHGALPTPDPLPAPSIMSPVGTPTGPAVWAAAGLEVALWDLAGKALGQPVHMLLGGAYRRSVRVYLDRSGVAEVADQGAWRALGEQVVEDGFDWLKVDLEQVAWDLATDAWSRSLGTAQIAAVVERIGLIRDAVGPGVDIGLDGHMAFDVESAIRVARALEPLRLRWLEDPIPIVSLDSLARVRAGSPIPIAAGEMFTADHFRQAMDADALDICHPDVLFVGGLREAQRVGSLADLHHLPVAFHDNGGAVNTIATAHVAATIPNLLGMEYHFHGAPWVATVARRDLPFMRDGVVPLDDAPGLGLELDEGVCRRHLADGETWFG
jgi:galactonate dehydratase